MIENQEVYRLWFEYLKENKYYRLYCEGITNLPIDQQKEVAHCGYFYNLFIVSVYWGNVYTTSWGDKLSDISNKIRQCGPSLFPYVPGIPKDYLMNKFEEFISNKQAENRGSFPSPSRDLSDEDIRCLWRYLEIYRRYQILKESGEKHFWKTIRGEFDPDGTIYKGDSPIDVLRQKKSKAGRIIENVGRNIFPGKYKTTKEQKIYLASKGENEIIAMLKEVGKNLKNRSSTKQLITPE